MRLGIRAGQIAGVTAMSSSSSAGGTSITLQFDLNRSIDAAAQDVQAMISRASRSLPPGMRLPAMGTIIS